MSNTNRRQFPRLEFDVEFKHWVLSEPSPTAKNSIAKNISAGGLCIMVFQKLKVGTLLKLEFSLRDADNPIIAKGKVVWIDEFVIYSYETHVSYDCGIEFVDISPHDQEDISRHVMINIGCIGN